MMMSKDPEKRELSDFGLTPSIFQMSTLMIFMMDFLMDGLFAVLLTKFNQESLNGKMLLKLQRTTLLETHLTLVRPLRVANIRIWDLR